MPCKAPNTPMVFLRVGEIAPARDGNDLLVHHGSIGFTREAMGLMGRFGFYRFLIGFYKFY